MSAEDEHGKSLLTMSQEAGQPAIERMVRARIAATPSVPALGNEALRWLNNRAGSATVAADGSLTMVAGPKTDWFNPPNDPASPAALANAPALVFTPRAADIKFTPTGSSSTLDWQFSARVEVEHRFLFDAATIFVHQGKDDWCKLCFEYSPEKQPTIVSVVTRGTSDDANGAAIKGSSSVHLRVSKYSGASIFAFHYSTDGGKYWTLHRIFTLRDPNVPVAVGLLAQAPTGESCTVRFSDIKFTPTTLANPRDGS